MTMIQPEQIFTDKVCQTLLPPERSHDFFEALFGDASEGAYDIVLTFDRFDQAGQTLNFLLNLHERPGRCLACNLTYGLPEVFSRHPVINVKGVVREIEKMLDGKMTCESWKLGHTIQKGRSLHSIPLLIQVRQP
jgi:hypothetical protein